MRSGRKVEAYIMSKLKSEAQRRKRRRQYQRALPQIEALYEELHQRFPNTFFREPVKVAPLKKGIYHEIKDAFSDSTYNTRIIDWTLNRFTRRYSYLERVAKLLRGWWDLFLTLYPLSPSVLFLLRSDPISSFPTGQREPHRASTCSD